MEILVYAPTKTAAYLAEYGCRKADTMEQLLQEADFVSLHCPLIPDVTYHLMNEKAFAKMKPTAFLINTSRGSVVDEEALVKALKEHQIQAAAIDVIEDEMSENSRLFGLENCILTPHAAFMSEDSFYEGRRRSLEHLVERLSASKKGKPSDLVNPEVI